MTLIKGRQPVHEMLRAGQRLSRLLVARGLERSRIVDEIVELARAAGVPVDTIERSELDRVVGAQDHQGVVAEAAPFPFVTLEELIRSFGEPFPLVLALDGIVDPRNLGALARTAEACAANGIVIARRRAAPVGPAAYKASAGALAHIKVARVTNLSQAVDELKERGLWAFGIDPAGDKLYTEADFKQPVLLVLGAEAKGISRLVRAKCDYLVRIPMYGKVSSLNVSVAGALVMYEIARQRHQSARDR